MPLKLTEHGDSKILEIHLTSKLVDSDFAGLEDTFGPYASATIDAS
jgi:hypothetical protein